MKRKPPDPPLVPSIVGVNLRKQRESLGLSQEELAVKAKLSRAWVGRVESGSIQSIRHPALISIAAALGVAVEVMLMSEQETTKKPPQSKRAA